MVVLPIQQLDQISLIRPPKPAASCFPATVPVVDLSAPDAAARLAKACQEFGFFKATSHGIPSGLTRMLEAEAVAFFSLSPADKQRGVGPPNQFGYGSKSIGANGDVGWLEYLLFPVALRDPSPCSFSSTMREYLSAIRRLASQVLELMAEGLGIEPREAISELVMGEDSEGIFRLNHYPPCPLPRGFSSRLTGFGEHTDPQVISVLRSNNSAGLEISLADGSWVPVLPDEDSFFINVGDALQVLTNGRFRSVRHRVVVASGVESRVSMIYFFGPAPREKIAPLAQLMGEGEQSVYREFTWEEYKRAAYESTLGDNRLALFESESSQRGRTESTSREATPLENKT